MTRVRLRHALKGRTFGRIRTRLAVLYAGLFALTLILVAATAQVMIVSHARASVRAELGASGTVFDRIWALRSRSLTAASDVLARDFGFRAAIASNDPATLESALVNLRERAGTSDSFIVTLDGQVIGSGTPAIRATAGRLPFQLSGGRRDAVVASGREVYRMVLSPILAPSEIGWIVFASRLDAGEMREIEKLSAIPLTATILGRDAKGHWREAGGAPGAVSQPLDDLIVQAEGAGGRTPETIDLPEGRAFVLARPLAAGDGKPQAVLLLSYPLSQALAPYAALQTGILAAGLAGLLLVVWGSRRLAAGISQPIIALDEAARALEDGERTEVSVEGSDELARLAASFNRMSAGILDRERRIAHLAFHDTLTGLPNRVFFGQQLRASLARTAKRNQPLAILCLGLDGFKSVNDTLGHPVGDVLLALVGEMLSEVASEGVVSRLGGDEFAIILDGDDAPASARILAQAIIDRIGAPKLAAGHRIVTSISVGVALSPGDGSDAETLLKNADLALHRAKQDGRGVCRFFESALDAIARQRREIELDLHEALKLGQLRLEYQPVFDVKANRVGGFEALLRWNHPKRGAISPVEFIPVAEETGLIVPIGEWVVKEATRQAQQWPGHLRVAVNVSPLQFRHTGFENIIFQALAHSRLAPNRLEIEITESVFLEGAEETIALLHRIRAMGVRIALDDFGTGYSSLSYLRSFPFDKIKIDRSFVTSVRDDESANAILRAIVDLAAALHMETTAEGVEHGYQLQWLVRQGVTNIQGFLFGASVGPEGVLEAAGQERAAA